MRLKSRDKWIPSGFQMIHPEAGMKVPWSGSFSEIVQKELAFRSKNPTLAQKHGWSLEIEDVESAVDLYNAQRMVASGFLGFVELEGDVPSSPPGGNRRSGPGVVAAAVSGLAIYSELFTVGKPVAKEVAEARAAICVECPMNRVGNLRDWFAAHISNGIMELYAMLKEQSLTTTRDNELGTCSACLCPLRAKIFIDAATLKRHTKPSVIAELDPHCWIPSAIS